MTNMTVASHDDLLAAGWTLLAAKPIRTTSGGTMWEMTIGEVGTNRELTAAGRDPNKLLADLARVAVEVR